MLILCTCHSASSTMGTIRCKGLNFGDERATFSHSLPDWVDLFPLHKFACEGDSEGVRRCIRTGLSADERDTDSWTPLHYACW